MTEPRPPIDAATVDRRRWRTALRSRRDIPRPLHLALVLLAERMDADGTLSGPREDLARWLDVPPRTLDRRIAEAREGGWLALTQRGQKGRVATHQATVPDIYARPARPAPVQPAKSGELNGVSARHGLRAEQPAEEAVSSPSGGELHIESERSEHGAVDVKRRRRREHGGACGPARSAGPARTSYRDRISKILTQRDHRRACPAAPPPGGAARPPARPATPTDRRSRYAGGAGGARLRPPRREATTGRGPPPSGRPQR